MLEKIYRSVKEFEITILADKKSIENISKESVPLIKGLISDISVVLNNKYDCSFNLSLNELSWDLQEQVCSSHKVGTYRKNKIIYVDNPWATYLLTLKEKAPFLTFHLQDIYRNILGIKTMDFRKKSFNLPIKKIAYGMNSSKLFSADEQENFITLISQKFKLPVMDISEIDLIEDVSRTLYIGPSSIEVLKFCEAGGKSIILTSYFQGFNLIPYSGDHLIISSGGGTFLSGPLAKIIEHDLSNRTSIDSPYSVYKISNDTFSGSFLNKIKSVDGNYPFYLSHVVLWNFLLSMEDVNLDIIKCTESQLALMKSNSGTLDKLIRLYDYALASVDDIYQQSKSQQIHPGTIEENIKNLIEIELITAELSKSHRLLRPFLDFYKIRRSQNFGTTLIEHSQNNYLIYAEEHQALKGLAELINVTVNKNEATMA
jgi:hypothetical protein